MKIPEIPAELAGDDFLAALAEFFEFRKQKRNSMTEIGAKRLLKKLQPWGKAKAIFAIQESISNGWDGVFEPNRWKPSNRGTPNVPAQPKEPTAPERFVLSMTQEQIQRALAEYKAAYPNLNAIALNHLELSPRSHKEFAAWIYSKRTERVAV